MPNTLFNPVVFIEVFLFWKESVDSYRVSFLDIFYGFTQAFLVILRISIWMLIRSIAFFNFM